MERGARKQVLISRIAFLESALNERDAKIVNLQKRLIDAEAANKAKKEAPEKVK